ncbi:amidase [Lolliginicoccus suaedae]|uniref:amidase n=1 Tax=Lolliginicoccus suaedae TaxID=2605429 RepID=UPI0011EBF934|nr:amidase family protein [Lolliginicoccus suaedae]
MRLDEYREHDGVGLARLVTDGQVTASELLACAIEGAERVDPVLNAIARPMLGETGRRVAEPLAGPFAGVPFYLKDLMQDYAGLPSGCGSRALHDARAPEHAEVVRRWLDAGLVILGKTSTPEFGLKGVTEPHAHGPCRNPWDPGRTPGGSSGGSAALVAAGVVPVAGANDGGGSIRIPASFCGLFGLKPGRGVVPDGPAHESYLFGASVNGVVSRSVRDSALMLDVLADGPRAGRFIAATRARPPRLRIGYSVASPIGSEVSAEAVEATERAAGWCEELGHTVEEAAPAIDGHALADDFITLFSVYAARQVDEAKQAWGATDSDFEIDTRVLAALGRATTAPEFYASHDRWHGYARSLSEFHDRFDLLLTPTVARPAPRIGELDTPRALAAAVRPLLRLGLVERLASLQVWRDHVRDSLAVVPFTQLANLTGAPAMSVPVHGTANGLPMGAQWVGPPGGEEMLLALAAELEEAHPWADHRPKVSVTTAAATPPR